MIIYPTSLPAFEAAAGRPLTHARIGWHTYTRTADFTDISVSSEEGHAPRDAPLRPDTYEFWQGTTLPAQWSIDLLLDLPVNYVGIAAHTSGSYQNTVLVETAPESGVFSTFAVIHAPPDDSAMLFLDTQRLARYVRITFSNGYPPRVGVINVGVILAMERSVQFGHRPASLSRQTVIKPSMSRTGQFLGQNVRSQGLRSGASFVGLSAAWYRANFEPFVQEARNFPFFFAWHPLLYPTDVAYVWATADVAPSQSFVDMVDAQLDMTGWASA